MGRGAVAVVRGLPAFSPVAPRSPAHFREPPGRSHCALLAGAAAQRKARIRRCRSGTSPGGWPGSQQRPVQGPVGPCAAGQRAHDGGIRRAARIRRYPSLVCRSPPADGQVLSHREIHAACAAGAAAGCRPEQLHRRCLVLPRRSASGQRGRERRGARLRACRAHSARQRAGLPGACRAGSAVRKTARCSQRIREGGAARAYKWRGQA